jgi:AcrR family transcriptional regulator
VHRTSIYYYFGKSKEAILQQALKTIGESFFGLTEDRLKFWEKNQISHAVQETRRMVTQAPHLVEFYFHWRRKPHSTIAKELQSLEERYFDKIKVFYPTLTHDQAKSLFGFFFGLSLAPHLTQADLDHLCAAALTRFTGSS